MSTSEEMADTCIFKFCYHCSDTDRLQEGRRDGERFRSIEEASKIHDDNLHAELQTKLITDPMFQPKYHKLCVTKYITKATRLSKNTSLKHQHHPQSPSRGLGHQWENPLIGCHNASIVVRHATLCLTPKTQVDGTLPIS